VDNEEQDQEQARQAHHKLSAQRGEDKVLDPIHMVSGVLNAKLTSIADFGWLISARYLGWRSQLEH
jgi:hypothetical protein